MKLKLLMGLGLVSLSLQAADEKQKCQPLFDLVWAKLKELPESPDSGIVRVTISESGDQKSTVADRLFMARSELAVPKCEGDYLVTSLSVPRYLVIDGQSYLFPIVSHWMGKDSDGKIGNLRVALVKALNQTGKLRVDNEIQVNSAIGGSHFPIGFVYKITRLSEPSVLGTGA